MESREVGMCLVRRTAVVLPGVLDRHVSCFVEAVGGAESTELPLLGTVNHGVGRRLDAWKEELCLRVELA